MKSCRFDTLPLKSHESHAPPTPGVNGLEAVVRILVRSTVWKSVHAGAENAAKELGNVEILWKAPSRGDDPNEQISIVQNFITRRVDGICLAPIDSRSLGWRKSGLWQQLHHTLRQRVRRGAGKKSTPTAAIIDSQSVRTGEGGYDAGKKITGRKRHLAVDTLGLVWSVVVHGAYWQDHDGACLVLMRIKQHCRRLKVIFADSAYARNDLPDWVRTTFGWILQTILRPVRAQGFVVLPKRWIVERTFAWLVRHRRHAKDYERNTETSEALIYITMISLMTRRLARQNRI